MNDVYLKNRTSSAITVAGYTVHYMDKTDAEIVEVEGVEHITRSDDATGTISAVTLPTAHSYTNVLFDSLRYYASGRLSNTGSAFNLWQSTSTWYYGTITWTDESLGDLSDKIIVNSTSSSAMKTQTVFRIIFICDSNISGYHPMDTAESSQGQITDYSYNNGVHSITFYLAGTNWTSGTFSGRIQFRYLDGVTIFNNLNAFDLVRASGGSLSKNTTSIRYDMYNVWNNSITIHAQYSVQNQVKYNAFKYLLSSVPYWYVIDGVQANWTDDLASIGYSEVLPLPTVSFGGDFDASNWLYATNDHTSSTIPSNSVLDLWVSTGGSHVKATYDSSKSYSAWKWYSDYSTTEKNGAISISNNNGYIAAKNETTSTVTLYAIRCAVCSSADATVVHVYDKSTGVAYNAFKYTLEGTDYYYILDGVQSDWSDDIDSLGFALGDGFTEITLYLVSGSKLVQRGVTSSYTGDVVSGFCYQLYTDAECTVPWSGYDYSDDYELGYYSDGEFVSYPRQTILDLPNAITYEKSESKVALILLDTCYLWMCSNYTLAYNQSIALSQITLRIYPKDQQYYAGYFNASSTYNNSSLTYGSSYPIYNKPNTGSDNMPLINDFPDKEIVGFYGSAGNLVSSRYNNLAWLTGSPLKVTYRNSDAGTLSIRHMLYTLEEPTYYGWVNLTGNTNSSSGTVYRLRDKEGNYIPYESGVLYTVIGLFRYDGSASGTINYLNMSYMGKFNSSYPNDLCWMQQYGSVSISYVWYIKKHVDTTGMAYCTNKGLNGGNKGSISNVSWYELYDADGNAISVDPSKEYVCTKAFLRDGTSVDNWSDGSYVDPSVCYVRLSSSSGTLKFNANPLPWTNSGYECYSMSYIEL